MIGDPEDVLIQSRCWQPNVTMLGRLSVRACTDRGITPTTSTGNVSVPTIAGDDEERIVNDGHSRLREFTMHGTVIRSKYNTGVKSTESSENEMLSQP